MRFLLIAFCAFLPLSFANADRFSQTSWIGLEGCYKTVSINGFPVSENPHSKFGSISLGNSYFMREMTLRETSAFKFTFFEKTIDNTHYFRIFDVPTNFGSFTVSGNKYSYSLDNIMRFEDQSVGRARISLIIEVLSKSQLKIKFASNLDYNSGQSNQLLEALVERTSDNILECEH